MLSSRRPVRPSEWLLSVREDIGELYSSQNLREPVLDDLGRFIGRHVSPERKVVDELQREHGVSALGRETSVLRAERLEFWGEVPDELIVHLGANLLKRCALSHNCGLGQNSDHVGPERALGELVQHHPRPNDFIDAVGEGSILSKVQSTRNSSLILHQVDHCVGKFVDAGEIAVHRTQGHVRPLGDLLDSGYLPRFLEQLAAGLDCTSNIFRATDGTTVFTVVGGLRGVRLSGHPLIISGEGWVYTPCTSFSTN